MMNDLLIRYVQRKGAADIPDELRQEYLAFVHAAQSRITPPTVLLGTCVMTAFGIMDLLILRDVQVLSLIVRIGIALPIGLVVYAYLTRRKRSLYTQYAVATGVSLLFGTLACAIVVRSSAPLAPIFITANNVTILFVIVMLGLPPLLAGTLAALLILVQSALLATATFATLPLILLTSSISLAIAIPGLYGNLRSYIGQRHAFLAQQRDREQLRALASKNALLERLSVLDPLTGLSNRRGFDAALATALDEARTDPDITAIALAMIDVDHFKPFNDTLGHPAGDEALRKIGRVFTDLTRTDDLAARYGGEEFAIVMPDAEPMALEFQGCRLRTGVEKLAIHHPRSPTAPVVTVSIGIAYATTEALQEMAAADLLTRADAALYDAKRGGRNRVVVAAWTNGDADGAPTVCNKAV